MTKLVQGRGIQAARIHSQHLNAHANLLQQERLAVKADNLHKLGLAAEKEESKLPMTSDSLTKLGAGAEYGA